MKNYLPSRHLHTDSWKVRYFLTKLRS